MAEHDSDTEYREYNLRSKRLRTEVWNPSSDPSTTSPGDIELETNDVLADAGSEEQRDMSSTPKSNARPQDITQDTCSTMTLHKLPTELLRDVYLRLEFPTMLAFKLVSKTLYGITLNQDGEEVVNLFEEAHAAGQLHEFFTMMIYIEAEITPSLKLERLTCQGCKQILGHATHVPQSWPDDNQNGFPDEHFDRYRIDRRCIDCLTDHVIDHDDDHIRFFHVDGMRYSLCDIGNCQERGRYEPQDRRPSWEVLRRFYDCPNKVYYSRVPQHIHHFKPIELCSTCFLLETRERS